MRKGFLLAIVMLCGAVGMAAAERFVTFERGGQTVCLTEMRGEVVVVEVMPLIKWLKSKCEVLLFGFATLTLKH